MSNNINPRLLDAMQKIIADRADEITAESIKTQTPPNGRFQQAFSKVGNSAQKFTKLVGACAKKVLCSAQRLLSRLQRGGETKLDEPAPKDLCSKTTGQFIDLLATPDDRQVLVKHVLSSLTNDGKSDETHGAVLVDFLKKHPECALFSSKNIRVENDHIIFNKPIVIPDTDIEIRAFLIDVRYGNNGEFRGEVAKYILQDADFSFVNLTDFCHKMSQNDDRNFAKMRLAKLAADRLNDDAELRNDVMSEHATLLDELVIWDKSVDAYRPLVTFDALMRPTDWGRNTAARDLRPLPGEPVIAIPDLPPVDTLAPSIDNGGGGRNPAAAGQIKTVSNGRVKDKINLFATARMPARPVDAANPVIQSINVGRVKKHVAHFGG